MSNHLFNRSGIMILGDSQYAKAAQVNDKAVGARVTPLPDESTITAQFDPSISIGSFRHSSGYLNLSSGWANAAEGIRQLGHKVKALGGKIIGDMHVQGLTTKDGKVVGVKLANGEDYLADTVVIATGSWTPSVFPAEVGDRLMATGQSVATVKLSEEEYARYQGVPCVLDLVSGFYAFPVRLIIFYFAGRRHLKFTRSPTKTEYSNSQYTMEVCSAPSPEENLGH